MKNNELLQLFDREQRSEIEYPDMRKDIFPGIVRFVRPAPGLSFVLYSRLDETNADTAIDAQVAYFRGLGQRFEWKVYTHDTPADLRERLLSRGFESDEVSTVMMLDLEYVPPALLGPLPASVSRLERREELTDVKDVLARVWGHDFDWVEERLGGHLEIPGYLTVYTATVEGPAGGQPGDQPGCVGWIYFHPNSQIASLWGGSTVKEYRLRGLYTSVLAARVQEAIRRGYRYLVIDAGPESKPIVERLGFHLLTEAYACEWKPAE